MYLDQAGNMTSKQENAVTSVLKDKHYTEYRKLMWCKPVGIRLICFDFEAMEIYWLCNNITGSNIKLRYNISNKKFKETIEEFETDLYNI